MVRSCSILIRRTISSAFGNCQPVKHASKFLLETVRVDPGPAVAPLVPVPRPAVEHLSPEPRTTGRTMEQTREQVHPRAVASPGDERLVLTTLADVVHAPCDVFLDDGRACRRTPPGRLSLHSG